MTSDLKDILSGDDDAVVAEVVEETTKTPAATETGVIEEADTGTTPAVAEVTPTPAAAAEKTVPLAALMAERDKRQELERKLQANAQAPQVPDFFADPEASVKHTVKDSVVKMSAAMVEAQHPDFRERLSVFMEEAARNPILQAELEAHPHPALFAYTKAKEIEEYRQMKDLPAFKEKLRAEIRAEVVAELSKQQTDRASLAASLPPDLSGARGAKAPSTDEAIHEPLESILK